MKLYLIRHGEASFDAPSDKARTLTAQGQAQTGKMAQLLSEQFEQLDLVLVSPYLRAQQSWQVYQTYLPPARKVVVLPELEPDADPATAHDLICAYIEVENAQTALVIAHMPLLGYLVTEFVPQLAPPLFATSALAHLELGAQTELISLYGPQELIA